MLLDAKKAILFSPSSLLSYRLNGDAIIAYYYVTLYQAYASVFSFSFR